MSRSRAAETVSTWSSRAAGLVPAAHWSVRSWKDCRVASDHSSKESPLEAVPAEAAAEGSVLAYGVPEADDDAEASPEAEGSAVLSAESSSLVQVMAVEEPTPRGSKPMMS